MTCWVLENEHSSNPKLRRGMCAKHYERFRKRGSPYTNLLPTRNIDLTFEEIIQRIGWTVVQRDTRYAEGPCWEWGGSVASAGYGRFRYRNRFYFAHRTAYRVWVGRIPEGLLVRHKCDNPPCINPSHLETGTFRDNARDREERGRSRWAKKKLKKVT